MKTTHKFIEQAIVIHNNKYDYSKTNYIRRNLKIIIVCPIHGEFLQEPRKHLEGDGCRLCNIDSQRMPRKEFINSSNNIHNNKYDYSLAVYTSFNQKVSIKCPIHGLFQQTPHSHLSGNGCPTCGHVLHGLKKRSNTEKFIEKANKLHKSKYDYSMVIYNGNRKQVKIICKSHGEFFQQPSNHLMGKGCPKCAHVISRAETEFLDYYGISARNYRIPKWKTKPVDGISGNVVYEFLGDYWHGNLEIYNGEKLHPKRKITYQKLNEETYLILGKLKSLGYDVKYIWESDWNKFKRGEHPSPRLLSV
jgi:hypothetical protein